MAEKSPLHDSTARARADFREHQGWLIPESFGDPEREYRQAVEQAAIFDWSSRGKIETAGPDAATFLQNLCSNEVAKLPVGAGCETFLTTAKAKVIAHALLARVGDNAFLLDLVPGMGQRLLQHLDHFLVSEQVELSDRTKELALLRLSGPAAASLLEQVCGQTVADLPPFHERDLCVAKIVVRARRHELLDIPSFDLFCSAEHGAAVWDTLIAAGAAPAGMRAHHTLRIEAGLPEFGIDMDENRAVMELGRTAQAISYTKGCFLGQEPIVMARDRGHVNRTLMRLQLEGTEPAPSGARVFRDGEEAGQITSSAWSPRLQAVVALAYLRRGHQEPGMSFVVEPETGGRKAEIRQVS